jgi:hypothetical protein
MIPHINLYLMIHVVVYFWIPLKVRVAVGITCFPHSSLLGFASFVCIQIYVKHNPLGLLKALVEAIFITICCLNIVVIVVTHCIIQKQN